MDSVAVYRKANTLVQDCGTRDAQRIARELGIWIYDVPEFQKLLGMYTCRWNHRLIFLNAHMEHHLRQMVLAHELGHDALHRSLARTSQAGLQEFTLFQMKDTTEYEANAFASHILLDNEEVYRLAMTGCDVIELSRRLGSDINLMLIKLQEMNKLGYDFHLPGTPDSRFFRKLKTSKA